MSFSLTEEDNIRCWEYVMNYGLEDIHKNNGLEINQTCSGHIKSKESFIHYVEDKRKSIRETKNNNKNTENTENTENMNSKTSSTVAVDSTVQKNKF